MPNKEISRTCVNRGYRNVETQKGTTQKDK